MVTSPSVQWWLKTVAIYWALGAVVSVAVAGALVYPFWWGTNGRTIPATKYAVFDDGQGVLWQRATTAFPLFDGEGRTGRWYETGVSIVTYDTDGHPGYPCSVSRVVQPDGRVRLRRIRGMDGQGGWSPVPINILLEVKPVPPMGTLRSGESVAVPPAGGTLEVRRAGWPLHCLEGTEYFGPGGASVQRNILTLASRDPKYPGNTKRVPFAFWTPCAMLGLAINSSFYGVLLWLVTGGPFFARRALRRRRGSCARCGYDLRGLATGVACPECGSPQGGARRV